MRVVVHCILLLIICGYFEIVVHSFLYVSNPSTNFHRFPRQNLLRSSTLDVVNVIDTNDVRKWFLFETKQRAEIHIIAAKSDNELFAAACKAILVSLKVLEMDLEKDSHTDVYVFPNTGLTGLNESIRQRYEAIGGVIQSIHTDESSFPLFQNSYERSIRFHYNFKCPKSGQCPLLLSVKTRRTRSDIIDIDEFTKIDAVTAPGGLSWSNDIEGFPFASIYDFISEINRPPDLETMSKLKFNYKVTDLKVDVSKLKKPKNPNVRQ